MSVDHGVIALTETNLIPSILDGELFNTNEYCVYRCDRSELNSTRECGGGTLIAVKSSMTSERVLVPGVESIEYVLVKIKFRNVYAFVCCLYIPSNSPVAVYQDYTDSLQRIIDFIDLNVEDRLYVLGDFNMTGVQWSDVPLDVSSVPADFESNSLVPTAIDSAVNAELIYLLLGSDLRQVNHVHNFQGRILDLVFCSDNNEVTVREAVSPMVKIDRYHPPIEIEFSFGIDNVAEPNPDRHEYNFRKADYDSLNSYLDQIDWNIEFLACSDVDSMVERFYGLMTAGFERFVPLKKFRNDSHPPWYSRRLLNLKNRKSRAHADFKANGRCVEDKLRFCSLRAEFDRLQYQAYDKYMSSTENNLVADPAGFWKYVNSVRKVDGYPNSMYFKNDKSVSMQEKCELFARFFESVYTDNTNAGTPHFGLTKEVDIGSVHIDETLITKALEAVDVSKGNGPDNVSPLFLKNCSASLSFPLYCIFNLSLSSKFPDRWKESYVVPIFKSGSRSDVECYRGVAILPTFGKLFESIVCDTLTDELSKKIVSVSQHGFLKGRSTSTNLVEFVSEAIRAIESGKQVDVIYTDVRKAFDTVQHDALIAKLEELGVHSSLLSWIDSYLRDRTQYVKMMGWESRVFAVKSGVPQGSHLGPLLFLLFFNDVTKVIKTSKFSLFADDLKLHRVISSVRDCNSLQSDITALQQWCEFNRLELSVVKCKVMTLFRKRNPLSYGYKIGEIALGRVREFRDLGVIITENLCFKKHVTTVVAKAYSMLGFVKRVCKRFKNVRALKSVYCAHVRSHLEYASVVWFPYHNTLVDRIESIQKKFVVYALRRSVRRDENFRLPPYKDRCATVGIEPLSVRRIRQCAFFVFDLLKGKIDAPLLVDKLNISIPTRTLRNHEYIRLDQHRTNYGLFEPITNMSRIFNRFLVLMKIDRLDMVTRHSYRNAVYSLDLTSQNFFLYS